MEGIRTILQELNNNLFVKISLKLYQALSLKMFFFPSINEVLLFPLVKVYLNKSLAFI
jgi:hypothetical protein